MNDEPTFQKTLLLYFLLLLSCIAYYFLSYQTARENFLQVIILFTFLFAVYLFVFKNFSITHTRQLIIAGVIFRMLLLLSVPNLSDDVYRFIWDGRLAANGINPFRYLPSEVIQMPPIPGITKELYGQLNSPGYYTIYPPLFQGIFWMAAKAFPINVFGAMVFMKSVIVIVEAATFFLILELLKKRGLPLYFSLLYILNPLVVMELTGNVHFEGFMILFVLLTFLFLLKNKWQNSAIALGLGIAAKLIPIIFIPLMVYKLGWRKGIAYSFLAAATSLVVFAIALDISTIKNLLNSAGLFVQHFEFNASIYYVVRWFGTLVKGYNIIADAGPVLYLCSAGIIFFISFYGRKNSRLSAFNKALLIISVWYLFATIVHPWYICLPVALSVFTPYRYAIVWSFTALLSYAAYRLNPVHENLWLTAVGYIVVIGYGLWEMKKKHSSQCVLFVDQKTMYKMKDW
jgi:hypothetical protein